MSANIPSNPNPRVVIVGGGFAGLKLVTELVKQPFQVVLIDQQNFHQFQPLYYQVATAGLEPSSIVFPFRKLFQKTKQFHFRLATVELVNFEEKNVQTTIGEIEYDHLVLSIGTTTNFFGNDELKKHALPMKTIGEALTLRNQLLLSFENALSANSDEERLAYLNTIIVGGGPTGVELAGTIAEMKKYILPKDFPDLKVEDMKIELLEGSGRLLNGMSDQSGKMALKYLTELGVNVRLNTIVESYDGNEVQTKDEYTISSKNLIWAAGVTGNQIQGLKNDLLTRGNRLKVNEFNEVVGLEKVYALGDIAYMEADADYPSGHPQVAQVAIQQAARLAKNLKKTSKTNWEAFKYKNLGSMATVGRNKAVVDLPKKHFSGFLAWVVWMGVHLKSILGVKNKFLIFLDWVWNYFTYNLSLRLIIRNKKD